MKFCNDDRKHFRAVAVKPTIYLKDDVGGGGLPWGDFVGLKLKNTYYVYWTWSPCFIRNGRTSKRTPS